MTMMILVSGKVILIKHGRFMYTTSQSRIVRVLPKQETKSDHETVQTSVPFERNQKLVQINHKSNYKHKSEINKQNHLNYKTLPEVPANMPDQQ